MYHALIKNGTWELIDAPLGCKPIGCKWIFRNKYKVDGSMQLKYCPTADQPADVFTKTLGKEKFEKFRGMLGLIPSD